MKAKISLFFIVYSLFFLNNLNGQSLCDQYGSLPVFERIDFKKSSELDFASFAGKHIVIAGSIFVDSDVLFKDCSIEITRGSILHGETGHDYEIRFENCQVFRCDGNFFSFLTDSQINTNVELNIINSKFENFLELFHINNCRSANVTNSEFKGLNLQLGHAFHFYDVYPGQVIFEDNTIEAGEGVWLEGTDNVTFSNNTFNNCQGSGIVLQGDSEGLQVQHCTFNNCGSGIKATGSAGVDGHNNLIFNNTFIETRNALDLPESSGTITLIDNNYTYTGTGESHFLRNSTDLNINAVRNHISATNRNYGFRLQGSGNFYAFGNTHNTNNGGAFMDIKSKNNVTLTDNIGNGARIGIAGVDYHNSSGNVIENDKKYAFYTAMSNGRFCNNSASSASVLFNFSGNCMDTDFTNNDMMGLSTTLSGTTGLLVDDVIGTQLHKGNRWNGAFSIEGATNTSIDPLFSLFEVNPNLASGGDSRFLPDTYSPIVWFDINQGSAASCNSTNLQGPSGVLTNVDRKVIDGLYNISPVSNWLADRNLLKKLRKNPQLLNDADANNWFTSMQSSAVYATAKIEMLISAYGATASESAEIRQTHEDYLADVANNVLDIQRLESIQATIQNRKQSIYNDVTALLSSLVPSNDYEEVFEEVYAIYIEVINDNTYTLSGSELSTIHQNANLCPLTFGPSVYIAQSMAESFNISYDEENCTSSRTRNLKNRTQEIGRIFPNPTSGVLLTDNIDYDKAVILDTHMNEIHIVNKNQIDVSGLQNGIYIIQFYKENSLSATHKFIKI